MIFREMTQADVEFVKEHSLYKGMLAKGDQPEITDWNYTLEDEGKIIGIGGFQLINLTTAWAWVEISEYAKGNLLTGYRTLKDWMNTFCEMNNVKRLMAYADEERPEAIRLLNHLGFFCEHKMEKFIGDKPALLFAKLYGE